MPAIGETRKGRELGRKDSGRYIWHACEICGKERWVQIRIRHGGFVKVRVCSSCKGGTIAGAKSPFWKGGRYKKGSGYVVVYVKADDFFFPMANRTRGRSAHRYGGYVQEHRLVMARKLGRCLHPWEIVHHLNGVKHDNREENLELRAGIGEHIRTHTQGYNAGYRRGLEDGRSVKIRQLTQRIRELENGNTQN